MNNDLYTEEFRNFKYLKSNNATVEFFKMRRAKLNSFQPGDLYDPAFTWPHVVEYVEQVLDLRNDTMYISYIGHSSYENSKVYEIRNPIIYKGAFTEPWNGNIATLDDIPFIENSATNYNYILCSEMLMNSSGSDLAFGQMGAVPVISLPIIYPGNSANFSAIFYDSETAHKFTEVVKHQLREYQNALSSFTARF